MARKINWGKTYHPEPHIEVRCGSQNTSYGFRHLAEVYSGYRFVGKAKACYYNRTWESYEYASVIHRVLRGAFPKDLAEIYIKTVDDEASGRIADNFKMIAGIAKLGEILCDKPEDQNAWKARMLKAGMPGLDMPADFESLPEEEKTRRLDGAINSLTA